MKKLPIVQQNAVVIGIVMVVVAAAAGFLLWAVDDAQASHIKLGGHVVDQFGDPVQGAEVFFCNTGQTDTSNNNGHFQIGIGLQRFGYCARIDSLPAGYSGGVATNTTPETTGASSYEWQVSTTFCQQDGGCNANENTWDIRDDTTLHFQVTKDLPSPNDDADVFNVSIPSTFNSGQTRTVSFSVRNTGNTYWYSGGWVNSLDSGFKFRRTDNSGFQLACGGADNYAHLSHVHATNSVDGTQHSPTADSWSCSLTAPSQPGTYTFKMRMHRSRVITDDFKMEGSGHPDNGSTNSSYFFGEELRRTIQVEAPPVSASLSASPNPVSAGSRTMLSWSSSNADSCSGSGPGFSTGGATSGSDESAVLNQAKTFTVTCEGSGGSDSDSVEVQVDSVASNQTRFDFQVDNDPGFNSPEIDRSVTGLNNPPGTTNNQSVLVTTSVQPDQLNYDTSYSWRVRVYDSDGGVSNWTTGSLFRTPANEYPDPDFSWTPTTLTVGEQADFQDETTFHDGGGTRSWAWTFQDGNPSSAAGESPSSTFTSGGNKTVRLEASDSNGFTCSVEQTVEVGEGIPEFREVPPTGLREFFQQILGFIDM